MIFGFKNNKCKDSVYTAAEIDAKLSNFSGGGDSTVQIEEKTYSCDHGTVSAIFRRSGNVVTVDIEVTDNVGGSKLWNTIQIATPNWAGYSANNYSGKKRACGLMKNAFGEMDFYIARLSSGDCQLNISYSHIIEYAGSVNASMTYIVD